MIDPPLCEQCGRPKTAHHRRFPVRITYFMCRSAECMAQRRKADSAYDRARADRSPAKPCKHCGHQTQWYLRTDSPDRPGYWYSQCGRRQCKAERARKRKEAKAMEAAALPPPLPAKEIDSGELTIPVVLQPREPTPEKVHPACYRERVDYWKAWHHLEGRSSE
jgi:hypothetical protein